jgi:hypothetical protein
MESETPAAIRESPLTNCVTTVTPTGTITPYLAAATDGGRWRGLASGVWLHIIQVDLRPLELP